MKPPYLTQRINRIQPSATIAISMRAAQLKAEGEDVISLSLGEPDFETPEHVKQAAIQAIHDGFTHYTPVDGILPLKMAIKNKLKKDNQLDYEPNQIMVSCGAKQAIYNLMHVLLGPGDETIIPAPYWVSYPDMVHLTEATPVFIQTDMQQSFKMHAQQLADAITEHSKLLIMNTPSNPSGMCYNKKELSDLAAVLKDHPNLWILSDEIYEHILWNNTPFHNLLQVCPDLYDRTVVVNGVSKAYAMTGWRIGYAAGPVGVIAAMRKLQSQNTSNPTSIAQVAAQHALNGPQDCVRSMCQQFKERHDQALNQLLQVPGFDCIPADGTFYCFVHVQEAMNMKGIKTDTDFSEYLLNHALVATVPGTAFGCPGYLRLSFATDPSLFEQAVQRIQALMQAN